MPVRHSLRLKFAVTFALAGVVLVLIHAVIIHQLNRHQEAQLIDQIVSDEMENLLQQYERSFSLDGPPYRKLQRYEVRPDTEALALRKWFRASWLIHTYVAREPQERLELPEGLRGLAPGFHDVFSGPDEDHYRVEVREIGHTRFYIAYSVSLHQDRARHFTLVLALSAALTVLATALIGFWLSGRLTHQIEDLARRVRQLDESAEGEVLERHYPEREVAELAAAFDGYHARTASLLQRERAFTADVSHELRTPLTALQTSCELMLEDSTLPPRSRARVEKIAAAAMRLGELVNAFLLMAREEADGISSEVDLRECIEEAVDSVRERAVAKGLSLQVDVPDSMSLRVPKRALHVVLSNLLANAVSYTEAGTVQVRSRGAKVEITDTGPGVAPDRIPELFRRFQRGDARGGDGFGLGLAIVKRICEQAGWQVGIERREEGGTRVYLALGGMI
ncbi:MAG: HAMP domain-containing histidine kinase [Rhodocyclaceae bacterium]|nr:HAMP domain-containing histidine kinase [Rhodocyclaceae bacterium]MCO5096779.1 HAMP domain-containing histidine kinase [Rhodocyclaceae bacterium]